MKLHLVGIGGVGMAGLAVLLKARGHEVSGCDLGFTPRTRWLESMGIRVFAGHDPSHVAGADVVIATPAVSSDNPELAAAAGTVKLSDVNIQTASTFGTVKGTNVTVTKDGSFKIVGQ